MRTTATRKPRWTVKVTSAFGDVREKHYPNKPAAQKAYEAETRFSGSFHPMSSNGKLHAGRTVELLPYAAQN